jgi:NAD(P)H-hydrate epimerase
MTLTNLLTEQAAASLAHKIVSAEHVRAIEPKAAQLAGISMYELMQRAGESAFNILNQQWPQAQRVLVVTGNGNNAGDGYVLATLCKLQGLDTAVACVDPAKTLTGDAQKAQANWLEVGGDLQESSSLDFTQFDLIVDALLGTGITGRVKAQFQSIISQINQTKLPVLSIDLPSGMLANTGVGPSICVKANTTVTFVAIKPGLATGIGKEHCGKLIFVDCGIGKSFFSLATEYKQLVRWPMLNPLPIRPLHSHKGSFGKLLCIGGNQGMAGAIRLSTESALRCGAGLVKVFCHPASQLLVASGRPEIMLADIDLNACLDWCNCIVIGPGLGQNDWAHQQFSRLLDYLEHHPKPLVVDADGLNLLATVINQPSIQKTLAKLPALILSPHPKEASRLLGCSLEEVENNRYQASKDIAEKYHATCILKGAGTVIHSQGLEPNICTWVCEGGNPGMATAGMGDTLTGILGAFLAQGCEQEKAAVYAVCAHAEAADRLAMQYGQRGMISSDLFKPLRAIVNEL